MFSLATALFSAGQERVCGEAQAVRRRPQEARGEPQTDLNLQNYRRLKGFISFQELLDKEVIFGGPFMMNPIIWSRLGAPDFSDTRKYPTVVRM